MERIVSLVERIACNIDYNFKKVFSRFFNRIYLFDLCYIFQNRFQIFMRDNTKLLIHESSQVIFHKQIHFW